MKGSIIDQFSNSVYYKESGSSSLLASCLQVVNRQLFGL